MAALSSSTEARWASMASSLSMALLRSLSASSSETPLPRALRTSSRAYSVFFSVVSLMPMPNSAASSKRLFDQAGPRPSGRVV
jgi:hypothetical protein